MSSLEFPLKDHLRDPVDEAALQRIAEGIDARSRDRKRRRRMPFVLVGATALALAVVAAVWHRHGDPGPLLFADGRELVSMTSTSVASDISLSDGSHIRLSSGARIEPLESTGSNFSAIVVQGRADFDVHPGGPRHWVIECGLATIEVVGTSFSCERANGRTRVEVRHGVVLVRGEHVPNRARRMAAGESLELTEDGHGAAESVEPVTAQNLEVVRPAEPQVAAPSGEPSRAKAGAPAVRGWRELARRGRHKDAYAALGSEGLRRESRRLGVNDLLALADVARLSGHPAEAVMPLQRILSEFTGDAQAPLAAFALGRLELDSLGHAHAAAAAFRQALDLGVPSSLREDARARLVEASMRSGDAVAARRAADAYLDEFPNGRYAHAVQGWLRMR